MTEEKDDFTLEIDEANLSRELAEQASKFAYIAEQSITAELKYNQFKLKVSELYAIIDNQVRQLAEQEGKKTTEKKIEGDILVNDDYKKASAHLLQLQAHMQIMKARREAFKDRGNMLVQLACNRRAEMDTMGFDAIKAAAM